MKMYKRADSKAGTYPHKGVRRRGQEYILKRIIYDKLKVVYESNNRVKACRFSMLPYREQNWLTNVPLYAVYEWIDRVE